MRGVMIRSGLGIAALAIAATTSALSKSPATAAVHQIIDAQAPAFLEDPAQILRQNPDGGPRLVIEVRNLVLSDPATLQPVLKLLPTANKDQKTGIGAGLAQAARMVAHSNPVYSRKIQEAVMQTRDKELMLGYAAASGDFLYTAGIHTAASIFGGGVSDGALPIGAKPPVAGPSGSAGPRPLASLSVPAESTVTSANVVPLGTPLVGITSAVPQLPTPTNFALSPLTPFALPAAPGLPIILPKLAVTVTTITVARLGAGLPISQPPITLPVGVEPAKIVTPITAPIIGAVTLPPGIATINVAEPPAILPISQSPITLPASVGLVPLQVEVPTAPAGSTTLPSTGVPLTPITGPVSPPSSVGASVSPS
jgi:hypothetical protein